MRIPVICIGVVMGKEQQIQGARVSQIPDSSSIDKLITDFNLAVEKYHTDVKNSGPSRALYHNLIEYVVSASNDLAYADTYTVIENALEKSFDYKIMHDVINTLGAVCFQMWRQQKGFATESFSLTDIAEAAFSHDFGKLFLDVRVLDKIEELTSDDRQTINTHPYEGTQKLLKIGASELSVYIALYHHEPITELCNYPDEFIALQIIKAADTYCAAREDRPGSPAMNVLEALDAVKDNVDVGLILKTIGEDFTNFIMDTTPKKVVAGCVSRNIFKTPLHRTIYE